jgi:hypothetical protein
MLDGCMAPHARWLYIVIYLKLGKMLIPHILYNIGGRVNLSPTLNFISRKEMFHSYVLFLSNITIYSYEKNAKVILV